MSDKEVVAPAQADTKPTISFRTFLEDVHPSVLVEVAGAWRTDSHNARRLACPPLRLHCERCDGEHWFRGSSAYLSRTDPSNNTHLEYVCSDCQQQNKFYSLMVIPGDNGRAGVYKYGEFPQFGVPVPNRLLKLFDGEDAENFKKGRRCESQGLGIGAFAYYRRVVEKHRNEIFNKIIKVCKTLGGEADLIAELEEAKLERQFTASIEKIKAALPQGLLINGHNPLLALHGALSVGLHNESDQACLQAARDVRIVLADLVEKMSMLRQDNTELNSAMQRLLQRKADADKKHEA